MRWLISFLIWHLIYTPRFGNFGGISRYPIVDRLADMPNPSMRSRVKNISSHNEPFILNLELRLNTINLLVYAVHPIYLKSNHHDLKKSNRHIYIYYRIHNDA